MSGQVVGVPPEFAGNCCICVAFVILLQRAPPSSHPTRVERTSLTLPILRSRTGRVSICSTPRGSICSLRSSSGLARPSRRLASDRLHFVRRQQLFTFRTAIDPAGAFEKLGPVIRLALAEQRGADAAATQTPSGWRVQLLHLPHGLCQRRGTGRVSSVERRLGSSAADVELLAEAREELRVAGDSSTAIVEDDLGAQFDEDKPRADRRPRRGSWRSNATRTRPSRNWARPTGRSSSRLRGELAKWFEECKRDTN